MFSGRREEESDPERLKEEHGEQSQAQDWLSSLQFSHGLRGTAEKNYRAILVLYFPFPAQLRPLLPRIYFFQVKLA